MGLCAQKLVLFLIRYLVPPHKDNELAGGYLKSINREHIQNPSIEWVIVRPDSLIDKPETSRYDIKPSPIRSAIFNSGQTSRINVAHFMVNLITNDALWQTWQGQTPVLYNA